MNVASIALLASMLLIVVSCSTREKASDDIVKSNGTEIATLQLRVYWASYCLEADENEIVRSRFLSSLRSYARGKMVEIVLETAFQARDLNEQRRVLTHLKNFMDSNNAKVKQVTWLSSARSFIAIDKTLDAAMLRIQNEPAHFRTGGGQ